MSTFKRDKESIATSEDVLLKFKDGTIAVGYYDGFYGKWYTNCDKGCCYKIQGKPDGWCELPKIG